MRPLLDVSAQEGARMVALAHLDHACAACLRLSDCTDREALHDLRVALRRLRSWLRAYEGVLEINIGRKHRRRIGRLARRTGPARDAEVQRAWLERLAEDSHPREIAWLHGVLERREVEAYARVRGSVERRLAKIDERLRPRLLRYPCWLRVAEHESEPRFSELSREAITAQHEDLVRALAQVELGDPARAHAARIAVKRLRYLVEPFKDELEAAREILRRLKELQNELGDLNDLHELALTVAEAGDGGAELDMAGLLSRIESERSATFERLASRWLRSDEERDALARDIDALVLRLSRTPAEDLEIERKYLLRALPPICAEHEPASIEQGYVPGERLVERVRRTRTREGETYVRTVKLGRGMTRIEVEEPCSAEVFTKLWALTEGRRVVKRRYAIEAGELVFEIDAFDDRELYLAEVELPSEDTEVRIPEWLAPYVEREVTGEDAYTNVNLAR